MIPFIGAFLPDGYTDEEAKMWNETHKMIDRDQADGHLRPRAGDGGPPEAVNIEFAEPLDEDEARDILREAPGLIVVDKREPTGYVTPKEVQGEFPVYVSRIRNDPTVEHGLSMWVVADNLRKGAALNAVQIAQLLHERGLLRQTTAA